MKIATLTLNPALDKTMYFDKKIKTGALNRAAAPSVTTTGGKGVNVSCVFKILGIESEAYGLIGGNNGDLYTRLLEPYDINKDFTRTKCETRMNVKIISDGCDPTEFNEPGGPVEAAEKEEILDKIKEKIGGIDFFFMGGSVPPGINKSIYKDIIDLGGGKTKFILDCDGEALKLCMENKTKPYIIKPNQFELEQYVGKKFDLGIPRAVGRDAPGAPFDINIEIEKIKLEIKKIYENTGVIVLCTLGEYGGLYGGPEGVYYINAPKVEVKGFTGAGDTFLTAFVAAYFGMVDFIIPRHADACHPLSKGGFGAEDSLKFAVAASAAKVTKPGTEFAGFDEMTGMYEKIVVL